MLARLGDHLVTLDALRESTKHAAIEAFGLDAATQSESLDALLTSHNDRYDVHMVTYLRYAHIVLTHMVLEHWLEAFGVLIVATRRGAPFVQKHGDGSLLKQFERYLARIGVSAPNRDQIEGLRLTRNCIVHSSGRVDTAELRSLVPRLAGVSIDDTGSLIFTTEGCLLLQDGVVHYLHELDHAAGLRIWVPSVVRENFERHIAPHLREQQDGL